ncbi:hypothetical protein [Mycobacterium parmense]|uniref:Uncharacterized protein n=1 Tax=Mycobacterium parmense TaxID=185642 RepID=A0A7I7YYZ1_9MYCO|nr:hypothetical protein [Mycobacterium parmense]BBZ46163.1 hypothetical protein MPRM_34440 [Mycobacterium parmense]
MTTAPQFILTFRGVEVGRYETPERAVAAARSVIDTEIGSRPGAADQEPTELPRIEWQPPRMAFPFDAAGYWSYRAQSRMRDAQRAAPPQPTVGRRFDPPPPPAPTRFDSPQERGIAGDASMLPRGPDAYEQAPVCGGPPQWESPHPPPQPVYGGPPPWATGRPPAKERQPKRRWFGKNRDESK